MTKKELQDIARKHKLTGFSQLNKGPLIELIKNKSSSPTPAPRLPQSKKSSSPSPAPRSRKTDCSEKYVKKTVVELKNLLKEKGHSWGGQLVGKKNQIIDYLCAIENELTCNPLLGKDCKGNLICDVTNKRNVCVPEKTGMGRVASKGLVEMMHNGKKIIGSATAIKKLKQKISEMEDDFDDMPPMEDDFDETITDETDIEEVLRRVQESPGDQELDDLSIVEKEVLKCLGLLA